MSVVVVEMAQDLGRAAFQAAMQSLLLKVNLGNNIDEKLGAMFVAMVYLEGKSRTAVDKLAEKLGVLDIEDLRAEIAKAEGNSFDDLLSMMRARGGR